MKWFIVFLLSAIVWLVASSLYIYDFKNHNHDPDPNSPPPYENLSVDIRHSFLGKDPDKVVCYRESHRNFYVFTFILLSSVVGLVAVGLVAQRRHSRKLEEKNKEVQKQKGLLELANTHIYSSIRYASLIQSSFLPEKERMDSLFSDHCLIYKPKDLVSGDFYFCRRYDDKLVVALGDCTGHGVPGAFLTVNSLNLLDNLVPNFLESPAALLNAIQAEFDRSTSNPDIQVGLDLSVCIFDLEKNQFRFAGAHQSLFIETEDDIVEIKGTRKGIGPALHPSEIPFEETLHERKGNETFYLFSDGLTDQFGGHPSRKVGKKQLLRWIRETGSRDLSRKQKDLEDVLAVWQGSEVQTDDVCLLGFRLG
jgi:sigma-B regulation protein RsbU (phosphoserine phosphatase)